MYVYLRTYVFIIVVFYVYENTEGLFLKFSDSLFIIGIFDFMVFKYMNYIIRYLYFIYE